LASGIPETFTRPHPDSSVYDAADIDISKNALLEAEATYQQCRASLIENCEVADDGLWGQDVNGQDSHGEIANGRCRHHSSDRSFAAFLSCLGNLYARYPKVTNTAIDPST
jgi:hypothetical protein